MPKNPLIGTPVASKKVISDLILWEAEPRYCRGAVDLPAGTYEIGQVLANETPAAASGAAGAQPTYSDVLCLENIVIASGQTREVAALLRGPALVNMDEVVRTTNETDAALRTRLADLIAQGVRFVREPAVQSTLDLDT